MSEEHGGEEEAEAAEMNDRNLRRVGLRFLPHKWRQKAATLRKEARQQEHPRLIEGKAAGLDEAAEELESFLAATGGNEES